MTTTLFILAILFLSTTIIFFKPWINDRIKASKFASTYRSSQSPVEIIYIDKLGNKWYGYKSLFDMKQKRADRAKIAALMAELCMTTAKHSKYCADIRGFMNQKNLVRAAGLLDEMERRTTWAAEPETLRDLAHVFTLLHGEDPSEANPFWKEKKLEIWKQDPDCEAFFLTMAFKVVRHLELSSETDLLNYLNLKAAEDALSMASVRAF